MPTFRVYEVQDEVITRKWMYEIEAPDEKAALTLVRESAVDPIDCGTSGEPFYGKSGFAVQPHDADSNVGWEIAVTHLNSIKRSH